MRNSIALLTLSVQLAGTVEANRFIAIDMTQAGAGGNTYGVSRTKGVSGDVVPVDVIGTTIVETGGALLAGAKVQADANGRAVTLDTGVFTARLAPGESASAAGQFVEVILILN